MSKYMTMENRIGFGKRLVAYILDGIVILIGGMSLGLVIGGLLGGTLGGLAGGVVGGGNEAMAGAAFGGFMGAFFGAFAGLALFAVLYNLTEALFAASPGKMLLGIKIGNDNTTIASKGTLFLRYVIKNIAFVSSVLAMIIGIDFLAWIGSLLGFIVFLGFFMIFGQTKQGIHDRIAKTAVFHKAALN